MWAIRRASIQQLRNTSLLSSSSRIFIGETDFAKDCSEICNAARSASYEAISDGLLSCTRFYSKSSGFEKQSRTFSSQVGAKSDGEVSEDEFSELGTAQDTVNEDTSGDENDDELSSAIELYEDEGNADDALNESETLGSETDEQIVFSSSAMCIALLSAPLPVSKFLDEWVEEGNEVIKSEIELTMNNLRKRRLFLKALQFSEWLESRKHVELDESNCYSRVDLIAKVQGPFKAENYINQLPESLRTEKVYRSLLASFVFNGNVKKAEEIFNKMKDSESIATFACDQMLLLYKKTDKKKIADVLLLMEKEGIKPSVLSFQILIDVKGQCNDIDGVESLLEKMEAEGLKPTSQIQASVAQYYVNAGLKDKAEAILEELEGGIHLVNNRWSLRMLIPIYASLGRAEEVERIWNVCKSDIYVDDYLAAIEAWGELKQIENAEAVFHAYSNRVKKPSVRLYTALLRVYAKHKMLDKGEELANQMAAAGCNLGPWTLDALVKLYVSGGEVEKADSILTEAAKKKRGKPLFNSFLVIMDKYAERGDVHNAEKMFQMIEGNYAPRVRQFQSLLNAYVRAKKPAYGFLARMKADKVYPSRFMSSQLVSIDAFRKSQV